MSANKRNRHIVPVDMTNNLTSSEPATPSVRRLTYLETTNEYYKQKILRTLTKLGTVHPMQCSGFTGRFPVHQSNSLRQELYRIKITMHAQSQFECQHSHGECSESWFLIRRTVALRCDGSADSGEFQKTSANLFPC